ncbi:HXXEE domain-containing protein [Siminovitchia fortis]|uniref:HXXEE domain-containing protein n=1 Tax=Siminovitchia fortis TaxID=254758 RepID=UPI002E25E8B7
MTPVQFAKDVFWIFLAITAVTLIAVLFSFYFPIFMLSLFFIHVFTHIGQAVYFRKYTPRCMASILLPLCILPFIGGSCDYKRGHRLEQFEHGSSSLSLLLSMDAIGSLRGNRFLKWSLLL